MAPTVADACVWTCLSFWNSTVSEGRAHCHTSCGCHATCAADCVDSVMHLNTSYSQKFFFHNCIGNCSVACRDSYDADCADISVMMLAASQPKCAPTHA